jgi:hypothetical protein
LVDYTLDLSNEGPNKMCTTVSGPDSNKICVFPFKHDGITYDNCTRFGNTKEQTEAWCSTKVDNKGKFIEFKLSVHMSAKYIFFEIKSLVKFRVSSKLQKKRDEIIR